VCVRVFVCVYVCVCVCVYVRVYVCVCVCFSAFLARDRYSHIHIDTLTHIDTH
jgi:hypothetical protein